MCSCRVFKLNIVFLTLMYLSTVYSNYAYSIESTLFPAQANARMKLKLDSIEMAGVKNMALSNPIRIDNSVVATAGIYSTGVGVLFAAYLVLATIIFLMLFGAVASIVVAGMAVIAPIVLIELLPVFLMLSFIYGAYKVPSILFGKYESIVFSNNIELSETDRLRIESSFAVPVSAAGLVDEDELRSVIKAVQKLSSPESASSIYMGSGFSDNSEVARYFDSTMSEFIQQVGSEPINHYFAVLTADNSAEEIPKPRKLFKRDLEFILTKKQFLHHNATASLTYHDEDSLDLLMDKIRFYSRYVTQKQLSGCLLHFMLSKTMARVVFVPYS